jgi:hypothetical protein
MFDRFRRSWALVKQSWGILKVEKGLVLFPIFSATASLAALASFVVPIVLSIDWDKVGGEGEKPEDQLQPWHYRGHVRFLLRELLHHHLLRCRADRLRERAVDGRDTNVAFGIRAAFARMPQILGWTLLSATVGMVLNMVAERLGPLGQLIIRLIGMAWAIATFFAVPGAGGGGCGSRRGGEAIDGPRSARRGERRRSPPWASAQSPPRLCCCGFSRRSVRRRPFHHGRHRECDDHRRSARGARPHRAVRHHEHDERHRAGGPLQVRGHGAVSGASTKRSSAGHSRRRRVADAAVAKEGLVEGR